MTDKDQGYKPPKVEVVREKPKGQEDVRVKKSEESVDVKTTVKPKVEVKQEVKPTTALFDIQKAKVNKYFEYLGGRLLLDNHTALGKAQAEFINLVNESLKLSYEDFQTFTLYLIEKMKGDMKTFDNGTQFRFMSYLRGDFPAEVISAHESYLTFLHQIAKNWAQRYRLKEQVDHSYVTAKLDRAGKVNVTRLFNDLTKV